MEKENLIWRTFADPSAAISEKCGAGPATYYIIDDKGTIRFKTSGSSEKSIDTALETMIREAEAHAK